jgi:DNA-binding NtrC family response regulator
LTLGPEQTVSAGILVYGRDEVLLGTRTMILENAGFRVQSAINYADAEAMIMSGNVSLVVLCHSLTPEDCEAIFKLVSGRNPSVSTLVLTAGASRCSERPPTAILSAFDGPRKLVEAVHKLLPEASGA